MVQQSGDAAVLDRTFAALADSTRRGVLERLSAGPASLSQLADAAAMTVTGMAKHVHVLEAIGLVSTEKVGRSRQCVLGAERLDEAMAWITFYQQLWERKLDGLEMYFTLRKGDTT